MTRQYASSLQKAVVAGEHAASLDDDAAAFADTPNFAVAVRMAIGQDGLSDLLSHMKGQDQWAGHDAAEKNGWIETPEK